MDYKTNNKSLETIISIDEAKQHLRIFDDFDNDLILNQIEAATQWAEAFTHRKLLPTDIHGYQETVSKGEVIFLPFGDISNAEVKASGVVITDGFKVNEFNNSIRFENSYFDVEVKYTVGFSDVSEVPAPIKQAVLLIVGNLYENREDTVMGVNAAMIPFGSKNLLTTYRLFEG
ncbi:hypothetical protein C942_00500 [Photobacterium marinum]|uniref:Phage gp6-like head-tail connector protein n=1 Tax=Photobacterium marinum TaxID=1056511 RepID=L8JCN5_9GAMM|nr:head-tail connector protein [Photobacterium marinum]ELR66058.1 hypothetical protein C942_00500 [Photobacterium marinum]